jgi:formylglycine-generating enzyme required for sulfatase activity
MSLGRDPLRIVGQTIAQKYAIERVVGEGGFAVVYRAMHTIWHKPVAIKFFNGLSSAPLEDRAKLTQDFIQEGALLTELSSETANIVQARDVGTYTSPDGLWMPFIVLEWLEGVGLDAVLESERVAGSPPWALLEVMRCLGPVFSALQVAHRRGVAHRDIKPANIFVVGGPARSGTASIKLLDFGVAKLMADNTHMQAALAKTGTLISSFTPQYGAPEQFTRSYGATGPWTDVFALALIAVEMLTGRPALDGVDIVQLAFSASNGERRPTPRAFGVPISDELDGVFERALAPLPAARFASAGEFWSALELAAVQELGGNTLPMGLGRSFSQPPRTIASSAAETLLATGAPTAATPSLTPADPSTLTMPAAPPRSRFGRVAAGVLLGGAALLAAALFIAKQQTDGEPAPITQGARPAPPPEPTPPPICPEKMATIPKGQFFMGSDEKDALANEKPSHNVSLDSFCIDLYEVTAGEYKACSDEGKCRRAAKELSWPGIKNKDRETYVDVCTIGDPERADHPANCVSWDMASTYCKAQGKRLPTEAEWEYATRGPDGRVYPWGDETPTSEHLNACGSECVAWGKREHAPLEPLYAADDGYATTAPVGKFEKGRSRFGPYDVVGNVWEWVADYYGDYENRDQSDPMGPAAGEKRVIRGGGWNGSYATWLRPSFRYAQDPTAKSHGIGFRCARSL